MAIVAGTASGVGIAIWGPAACLPTVAAIGAATGLTAGTNWVIAQGVAGWAWAGSTCTWAAQGVYVRLLIPAASFAGMRPQLTQEIAEGTLEAAEAYSQTGDVGQAVAVGVAQVAPEAAEEYVAAGLRHGIPGTGSAAPSNGPGRKIYRGMTEGPDGLPQTGPTARQLGVRPGQDLPVNGGQVKPNTGGMSVAPDTPENLPSHRRPPSLGGTGKDPVWELDLNDLDGGVTFRQDAPKHGLLEPGSATSIDKFQQALAALAEYWKKL